LERTLPREPLTRQCSLLSFVATLDETRRLSARWMRVGKPFSSLPTRSSGHARPTLPFGVRLDRDRLAVVRFGLRFLDHGTLLDDGRFLDDGPLLDGRLLGGRDLRVIHGRIFPSKPQFALSPGGANMRTSLRTEPTIGLNRLPGARAIQGGASRSRTHRPKLGDCFRSGHALRWNSPRWSPRPDSNRLPLLTKQVLSLLSYEGPLGLCEIDVTPRCAPTALVRSAERRRQRMAVWA